MTDTEIEDEAEARLIWRIMRIFCACASLAALIGWGLGLWTVRDPAGPPVSVVLAGLSVVCIVSIFWYPIARVYHATWCWLLSRSIEEVMCQHMLEKPSGSKALQGGLSHPAPVEVEIIEGDMTREQEADG